eukprot:TRINITY_DN2291_c0_g2_i1.p1 TRINITY_DN2291_c0_g2~~TRINITY_DN2291_c0_g2_i1.p1  ORF type:complete len:128 (-),score=39.80 TRINITY_DN2291_c0_g2_i1:94-420(-)
MSDQAIQSVKETTNKNKVYVYSKSYCPYCVNVKKVLKEIGVEFGVIELDEEKNGADIQKALETLTSRRTVPSVWVGGKCIGGNDDVVAAKSSGKLKQIFDEAGVVSKL